MRASGVRFGDLHSFDDLNLFLATRPDLGSPEPKTNVVEVPGMDGVIDMTEANSGEVRFSNRTMRFEFSQMVDVEEQESFKATIMNKLHGRYFDRIILDESPEWFYSGRCSVSFEKIKPWKLRCVVVVDAKPYAMKTTETAVDLIGGTYTLVDIDLDATNQRPESTTVTDLALGTKFFQKGLIVSTAAESVRVNIPPQPQSGVMASTIWKFVQFVDSDGGSVTVNITDNDVTAGHLDVSVSTLLNANVSPRKVYRVLVAGLVGCTLSISKSAWKTMLWNERKTVAPTIVYQVEENEQTTIDTRLAHVLSVIINGKEVHINDISDTSEEVVLKGGWNEIVVPTNQTQQQTIETLKFIYREGRL